MIEPTADRKFGNWSAPEIPLSVEYSVALMEEIRAALAKNPAELEMGGVLFGTRQHAAVRVIAWRPIHCEHADGPAFDLSSDDRRELLRLLLAARSDPKLVELQPVGWFVSHSSGELALHHRDVVLAHDFFTEPWQVTLVLTTGLDGSLRARFFARDAKGNLRTEAGSPDIVIEPLPRSITVWKTTQWNWANDWARVSRYFPWAVAAALAIILTAVLLARHPVSPPVAPGFVLRIEDAGPAVEISWDPDAEAVRAASRGEILLQDGSQASQMTLDAIQLRQGKVRRPRKTNNVQARMKLYLAVSGEMQEFARLFIKTVSAPAATPVPDPLEAEVERLNQQLHRERTISDRLKQTVKILENTIAVDSARKDAK